MDMKKAALLSNIALPQIIFATAVKDFPNGTLTSAKFRMRKLLQKLPVTFQEIQENQLLFVKRNLEDFLSIMKSWNTKLYAILENQMCKGYAALQGNHILEMYLTDENLLFTSLEKCLTESNSKELFLRVSPCDSHLFKGCTQLFESFSISLDDNYMIFDYPKVLEFFLNVKASYIPLSSGSWNFTIKEHGSFKIQVDSGIPSVTQIENPEEHSAFEYAIRLGEKEGADLLIATDPDADRLGAAVRLPNGSYEVLTGNQIGALFAQYIR